MHAPRTYTLHYIPSHSQNDTKTLNDITILFLLHKKVGNMMM